MAANSGRRSDERLLSRPDGDGEPRGRSDARLRGGLMVTTMNGSDLKSVPAHLRRKAMIRQAVLDQWHAFEAGHADMPRVVTMRTFVTAWNLRHSPRISASRIYAWELQFKRASGIAGLVDGRGRPLSGARFLLKSAKSPQQMPLGELCEGIAGLLRLLADRLVVEGSQNGQGRPV